MKDESRMRYKTLVQSLMVGFNFLKCCWVNRPKSNTPGPFVYGSTLINNYYKASTLGVVFPNTERLHILQRTN